MRLLPWIRSRILLKDRLNLRKSLQLEMPQSRLMLLLHKSLLLPLEARRRTIRFNNAACDDISLPTHRRFYLNGLFYTTRKWNHFSLRLIQIAFPSISNTSLLRCLSTNYVTFVSFWFLYFLQFCVYFLFPLAHYGFFFSHYNCRTFLFSIRYFNASSNVIVTSINSYSISFGKYTSA